MTPQQEQQGQQVKPLWEMTATELNACELRINAIKKALEGVTPEQLASLTPEQQRERETMVDQALDLLMFILKERLRRDIEQLQSLLQVVLTEKRQARRTANDQRQP